MQDFVPWRETVRRVLCAGRMSSMGCRSWPNKFHAGFGHGAPHDPAFSDRAAAVKGWLALSRMRAIEPFMKALFQ